MRDSKLKLMIEHNVGTEMNEELHKDLVFEENRKSVGVAYLLWLFLGWFGVHRFYAGATKSAIVQLLLAISVVGLIVQIPWWLFDSLLVPGLVHDKNRETFNMINFGDPDGPRQAPERKAMTEADRKREAMLEDLRETGYRKDPRETSYLYRNG